jgi:peptidylprolyl isomerase
MLKIAGAGNTVRVHYTGKLEDGEVFDSSRDGDPLEFVLGAGQLLKDFEGALVGLAEGSSVTVHIPADEAYGPYREDMLLSFPKDQMPEDAEQAVGSTIYLECEDGVVLPLTIKEIGEETVTLDSNHLLAGKDLTFDIELVEIVEPEAEAGPSADPAAGPSERLII